MKHDLTTVLERCTGYTSDTRAVRAGDLFVALKGATSDGHDFLEKAFASGATAALVREGFRTPPALAGATLVEVADVHAAHRQAAAHFRARFKGKIVAVGGSSGKTSTKEFLAHFLAARRKIAKTDKSQNGELGIPKTLEKLRPDIEVMIVEVGIDAPGDMARHAALVNPDVALLTSIGEEHLNLLKTVDNVFTEEKILFDVTLARGGVCFAPGGDPWLRRLAGTTGIVLTPSDPTLFSVKMAAAFRERLPNAYAIQNATLAALVAREFGVTESDILSLVPTLTLPDGRGGVERLANGVVLVADHYNSNPSSLKAALASAGETAHHAKLPLDLVLGDMLDLGDMTAALHESVYAPIRGAGARHVTLVGPEMAKLADRLRKDGLKVDTYADSAVAAGAMSSVTNGVVLVKGSRGMALEKVLERLRRI